MKERRRKRWERRKRKLGRQEEKEEEKTRRRKRRWGKEEEEGSGRSGFDSPIHPCLTWALAHTATPVKGGDSGGNSRNRLTRAALEGPREDRAWLGKQGSAWRGVRSLSSLRGWGAPLL